MNAATGEIKSLVDALYITDSTITGGILNAGRIESTDSDGMNTNRLVLNGNLDNRGTIQAGDNGLELQDSVIRGSVINSGTIVAGGDGIYLTGDDNPMTVSGDIRNSDRIEARDGSAIRLRNNTTVQGAIVNTATGRLFGTYAGIEVDGAVLAGGIDNAGLIEGTHAGIDLEDATVGGIRITGAVGAGSAAIFLTGNTDAGGLTLQGQAGKPALLDSQGYAVLVVQPSPVLRSRDEARLGGMTMAGHAGVHGDIYAPGERVTVTGKDNYLSGALDIRQLTVQAGGELVLDKLESTSARNSMLQAGMASDEQPFLTDALKTADGVKPALLASTKQGSIYVMDRRTGEAIVPITEVPAPGGAVEGDHTAPTQPRSDLNMIPPVLTERDMWGVTPFDQMLCRINFKSLRYDGMYTPPSLQGSIVYPGNFGVFDWGGISVDPVRQIAFLNPSYMAFTSKLVPQADVAAMGPRKGETSGVQPNKGAPYGVILEPLLSPLGLPCQAPAWGYVAAVDLTNNEVIWKHKNGTVRDSSPVPIPLSMGVPSLGGTFTTAGGVAFLSGTLDQYLRAYDVSNGKVLWEGRLPAGGQTTPMTYTGKDGKQYVLVMAGGHGSLGTKQGDYVMAFKLSD